MKTSSCKGNIAWITTMKHYELSYNERIWQLLTFKIKVIIILYGCYYMAGAGIYIYMAGCSYINIRNGYLHKKVLHQFWKRTVCISTKDDHNNYAHQNYWNLQEFDAR